MRFPSPKAWCAFAALYAGMLFALMGLRPLWLDEILQLLGTTERSAGKLLEWVALNPGGAPLGYLGQWVTLRALGYSVEAARLLPACCGAGASLALLGLSRRLRLRWGLAAMALFAIMPLQFRYALEARPYSQGMLLSVLATIGAVALSRRPDWRRGTAYAAAVTAGLFTQPYTLFVAMGHLLWFACWDGPRCVKARWCATAAVAGAAALAAPWFLYAQSSWSAQLKYTIPPRTLLPALREMSGGGYVLTVLVLLLALAGMRSAAVHYKTRLLLFCCTVMPALGAFAADAAFGYFFAIRQFLFLLPGLVLLAVEGLRCLYKRDVWRARVAGTAMLCLAIWNDAALFHKPREDWASAARVMERAEVNCVTVVPESSLALYRFFAPSLRRCTAEREWRSMAMAVTPYSSLADDRRMLDEYLGQGFRVTRVEYVGRSWIRILEWETADTRRRGGSPGNSGGRADSAGQTVRRTSAVWVTGGSPCRTDREGRGGGWTPRSHRRSL
ncbi:MAG: glycosyltransferase family 39 protein [Bryobacterales bacterium]|nr:glycosyltransferase family 39 protein [Bryobacterales bacterium]